MQRALTERKRRGTSNRRLAKKYWRMYVLLAVPVCYMLVFHYYPMLGAQIAFKRFNPSLGIWGSEWAGFEQFTKFFSSSQFTRVVPNTIFISFYALVAGFPIPILLALTLNTVRNLYFKKTVQMVTYTPHFISVVVIVGMMMTVFNPRSGLFGIIFQSLTSRMLPDFFAQPMGFRHLYVWSGIWQGMGWSSIIYIAALSAVDPELHEAAHIDGASRLQRIVHIDVPSILPTAVILLILNCGSIMSVGFEKAFLMQNTLNLRASEVISTYVYKVSLTSGRSDFSYGAAIGLFNAVINLSMLYIVNLIARKMQATSLW